MQGGTVIVCQEEESSRPARRSRGLIDPESLATSGEASRAGSGLHGPGLSVDLSDVCLTSGRRGRERSRSNFGLASSIRAANARHPRPRRWLTDPSLRVALCCPRDSVPAGHVGTLTPCSSGSRLAAAATVEQGLGQTIRRTSRSACWWRPVARGRSHRRNEHEQRVACPPAGAARRPGLRGRPAGLRRGRGVQLRPWPTTAVDASNRKRWSI
jgi:hypothetical protein